MGPSIGDIVVAEDDDDFRVVLAELLRGAGYSVREAVHGGEALAAVLGDPPPALLVLDLMMPVMSGVEVLAELARHPTRAKVPVVILSARAEPGLRQSLGVAAVLTKPVDIDDLLRVVRSLV